MIYYGRYKALYLSYLLRQALHTKIFFPSNIVFSLLLAINVLGYHSSQCSQGMGYGCRQVMSVKIRSL